MADLSNLKISESYGRVLQRDPTSGELQDLLGTTPTSIKFNGTTLQYVDGNQQNNYVLISDAQGNASWAENTGGGSATVYWSSDTTSQPADYIRVSGNSTSAKIGGSLEVSGNTILGGALGVTGNTEVKGSISADTGIYSHDIFTSFITTTASSTDTLVIESDKVNIKSFGGAQEFFEVRDDQFRFYKNSGEAVNFFSNDKYLFNAGSQDINFVVSGPTDENTFFIDVSENRIRAMYHLVIGKSSHINNTESDKYGLAVTGSSLFYPGTASTNCINAPGPISANTVTGQTSISTYGTIYSANTDLLDIFQVASAITEILYWSADTTPSDTVKYVRLSGNSTSAKIGGNLEISGGVTSVGNITLLPTANLIGHGGSNITSMQNIDCESLRSVNASDTRVILESTVIEFYASPNQSNKVLTLFDDGISGRTLTLKENLGISGNTYFPDSTSDTVGRLNFGASNDLAIYHNGSDSYIKESGTGRLHLQGGGGIDIISPADESMALFNANSSVDLYYNNTKRFETTDGGTLITGNLEATGGVGISGDTEVIGTLSADTMSGRTLTLKENLGVTGNTFMGGDLTLITDGQKIILGTGADTEIQQTGSETIIKDASTGNIKLRAGTITLQNGTGSKTMGTFNGANKVELFYNNNSKFETTNIGVSVTGEIVATGGAGISGNTEVGGTLSADTMSGRTLTLKENLGVTGTTTTNDATIKTRLYFGEYGGSNAFIAAGVSDELTLNNAPLSLTNAVGGSLTARGGVGISGDTEVGGTLSADTMSGRTLTLKENLGVSGNTIINRLKYEAQSLTNDTGSGEVAYFGSGSLTAGKLYYLNTSGTWTEAHADASSNEGNSQMLGIALGSSPTADGVLLRGFFDMHTYFTGTFNEGIPVYVDDNNSGYVTVTQPAGNNEFVRVVGFCTTTSKIIYFNPDSTYITVNA